MISSAAFVSGAARGIGKAISLRLARDGFNVAINDLKSNASLLEATADEIRAMGRLATLYLCLQHFADGAFFFQVERHP